MHSKGFTLIELIVVILILGILAAIAAPKFINLTGQSRVSALNGLRGAVNSAATLANGLQVSQGLTSNASITIEGVTVAMVNGYPSQAAGGIDLAVRFDAATFSTTGSMTFQVTGAPDSANCKFTYSDATATQPPAIPVSATSGC